MVKSNLLQCSECGKAKKGEPLYLVDGEIVCPFCGMALITEKACGVEFVGYAGYMKNETINN